jgi:hypothetical protein
MQWKEQGLDEPVVYGLKQKGRICISGTVSNEEVDHNNGAITSRFWLSTIGAHHVNELHRVDYNEEDHIVSAKIYSYEPKKTIVDLVAFTHRPHQLCITARDHHQCITSLYETTTSNEQNDTLSEIATLASEESIQK